MKRLISSLAAGVLAVGVLLAVAAPASAQYYQTDEQNQNNLYLAVWDTVHISSDGSSASWDISVGCAGDATYYTVNSASVEERNPPEIPQLRGEDNGIPARAGSSSYSCEDSQITLRLATQNTHWQDCVRDENGGILECYQREGYFPLHAARADDFDTGVSVGVTSYNDNHEQVGSAIYCAHPACAGNTGPYVDYDGGPSRAPAPPSVTFGSVLEKTIMLRWTAPTGSQPTSYIWGWTGSDGSSWSKEYPVASIKSPFTLTNLKPNTTYTISIQSKNASGTSSQLLLTATTAGGSGTPPNPPKPPPPNPPKPPKPPKPPVHQVKKPGKPVSVKGRAGRKLAIIIWGSARANGARVNAYQVHRFNGSNKTTSGKRVVFRGLKAGKTYRFYVRAHNKKGWGPWSKTVQVRPKAAAHKPKPKPTKPKPPPQSRCHPDYSPCLPIVGDLDCSDINGSVRILHGRDPYRLDNDQDGVGCES
jgi:hypothetical protein